MTNVEFYRVHGYCNCASFREGRSWNCCHCTMWNEGKNKCCYGCEHKRRPDPHDDPPPRNVERPQSRRGGA
jgi:hypothetical protein